MHSQPKADVFMDVVVLGKGAAGLTAAIDAADRAAATRRLERERDIIGSKLASTESALTAFVGG